ncbi:alpha/beta hydrolase [Fundicoccus culcitae]|uniref:Alpha/beta hydrolase n=1 Tax=Fundicoccus culcitae TaxID=2969821 RepID=A0ABY5P302_9LACT|nr:alpha/beta hydrolase [Fundicoccus culcitae]UUX33107.1 alpha/beta hydrolase [Fundicoccus culcitae]
MRTELLYLYDDRKDVTLKAYLLEDNVNLRPKKTLPAIIINPGGGYMYCSPREAEPIALRFNAMGYHAFVLEYSVYGEGKYPFELDSDLPVKEHSLFPHAMQEIAMSFELIHQHAAEWKVDTNQIGTIGFSAGGHNVAMYANNWNTPVIQDAVSLKGDALKPAFNIVGYPLTDLINITANIEDLNTVAEAKPILIACFGKSDVSQAELEYYSPARNVNSDTPPTFIWTTSEDQVVAAQDSIQLALGLAHNNIPFELHVFEKGPHGLSLANPSTARAAEHINPKAATWAEMAEKWLNDRFPVEALDM